MNKYSNREEFIREYEELKGKIKEKKIKIKIFEDLEIERIVKEIDFKGYNKRHNTDT